MTGPGEFGTAVLLLEDGRAFRGSPFGARGTALGEAVFTTGMTGYQETLTDPSYRRQIVVATAPQIGNTGWVGARPGTGGRGPAVDDNESERIQVAGFVVREVSPRPSNYRATTSLPAEMARQGVVGIREVDTRALTRHLRSAGAMRCGIFSAASPAAANGGARAAQNLVIGPAGTTAAGTNPAGTTAAGTGPAHVGAAGVETVGGPLDAQAMLALVRSSPPMVGADLAVEVSTRDAYTVPAVGSERFRIAALDLGIKASTPRLLAARGITSHVLPAGASIEEIRALRVDGVLLSNGPGDPATADEMVALTAEILRLRIPLLGICFGNQILGRALGFGTYKLPFGHRGINQPVREEATGRVLVTCHNHGFAVDAPAGRELTTGFGRARVSFTSLNDGVVEGLHCLDAPAFSVQFHPEAAAGPHDAAYLFERFADLMAAGSPIGGDA